MRRQSREDTHSTRVELWPDFDFGCSFSSRSLNAFGTFNMLSQHAVPQTNRVSANTINTQHLDTRPIHEVLLEPIQHDKVDCCSLRKDSPVANMFEQPSATLEMDTHLSLPTTSTHSAFPQTDSLSVSAPVSRVPSRAPSRGASTLPSGVCLRNGLVSAPSPILEPNGIAAGTYQRGPNLAPADCQQQLKRRSTLDQEEQWIQVQKADSRGWCSFFHLTFFIVLNRFTVLAINIL